MKRLVPAAVAVFLAGCGGRGDPVIPEADRLYLEGWASVLAPAMLICEDGRVAQIPDSTGVADLMAFCDGDPARYVYLYGCLRDSLAAVPAPDPSCLEGQSAGGGAAGFEGDSGGAVSGSPGGISGRGPST